MLYALGDPVSLLLLLVSFVLAVTLHGWVQQLLARSAGARGSDPARTSPDPRRQLDPFGAVAGAIAGVGWAKPVHPPDRRDRRALLTVLLGGPAANLLLAAVLLVAYRLVGGPAVAGTSVLLQYGVGGDLALRALLLSGLSNVFVGGLSLVPIPPMDGGRLLFALAPETPGWRRAQYQLDERGIGIAVLLALLIIPLGGPQALLPVVLDTLLGPLVGLVTGG